MYFNSLSKISLILFWLFLLFEITISAQSYSILTIQGNGVNIRENPNINSKVVVKLNTTDECLVLAIGDKEKVDGKEDYWYKVKYKSKIGWVFGAFTSIRQQGRITITAVFEDCDAGDMEHILFKDIEGNIIDFGGAPNNLDNYELCVVPEDDWVPIGNPKYVGKKFQITYLINYCLIIGYEGNVDGEIIEWPTIVELKLM